MYSLRILLPDSPAFALHSPAPQPPLEGLRWLEQRPGRSEDEVIEVAQIGLRGAGIRAWLEGLQAALAAARQTPFALLERRSAAGDEPLFTALRDGWLEAEPPCFSPSRAAFSVRLCLCRAPFWRKTAAVLPLSNANGSRVESGLSLLNHQDGDPGHQNVADIAAADLSGGQPAPLSLRLVLTEPSGQTLQRAVIAVGSRLTLLGEAFPHALEGEQAETGADCTASSQISDATASGAAYRRVQWTRSDSASLLRWTLSPYRLGFCAGRLFRPTLRLASPPTAELYLRWRLLDGNARLLEESPAVPLRPQSCLQVGAALCLPPRWLPGSAPSGLLLELRAESRDSGLKTLDVDFLHLLPGEGWLEVQAVNGAASREVWVDGEQALAYTRSAGGEVGFTHTLLGAPPSLLPGCDQRLFALWESEAGMPIHSRCQVQAFYAPRVSLP